MKKPNIFDFASSELSQDAVLIWLANWAKNENSTIDTHLHETGKYFLNSLLIKTGKSFNSFNKIKVIPQYHKIDIYIELTTEEDKFAIIIEDKTKSSEHSNQLEKYYTKISNKDFEKEQIIPIYLKTGFQHDFDKIDNRYSIYLAKDLLRVFAYGLKQGVKNEIFTDYFNYLTRLQSQFEIDKRSFEEFSHKTLKEWNWWNWIGFFDSNSRLLNANWGIVPNGRESLVALWFGGCSEVVLSDNKEITLHPYIDVKYSGYDHYSFSYRLGLNGNPQRTKRHRDEIINRIRSRIEEKGIHVKIPRFRKAKETIELLKIVNVDNDMNEKQVIGFLKLLELALKGK